MPADSKQQLVFQQVDFDPFQSSLPVRIATTQAQREIWTNVQFGGHAASCAYNESVSLHLEGDFNFSAIVKAVDQLFERHDALRSVFSDDGMFFTIEEKVSIDVAFIDLSSEKSVIIDDRIQQILDGEAEHEFDLAKGPLGKISVIKIAPARHQLILTFHHIVCDGWSLGIMMQDLGKMYTAIVKGEVYNEPPAISYAVYSAEEVEYLKGIQHAKVEQYWIDQYKNDIPAMEMPVNHPRPPLRTYNAKRIDVEVGSDVVETIKKIGARQGVSFVATLVAAFEIFMYRITGSADIVVGLAAAGQAEDGKDSLVGHCVNLLPLRSKVNPVVSFNQYLKERKSLILDAYDHQRYTFGSLIQKLNIPRDPGRIPLVPVSFNVDLGITNGVHFEGCSYHFTTNARHYENFELFVNAAGSGKDLTLECTFNTDLFDENYMQLRAEEFVELLKGFAANPDKEIGFVNILTSAEQKWISQEWQGPVAEFPADKCLHQLFESAALNVPDKVALQFKDISWSYQQLNTASDKLAAYLQAQGLNPGTMVAVFMERCPELLVSLLGILKAGGAYVPVDLSYPADRIAYLLSDANASLIISSQLHEDKLQGINTKILVKEKFSSFPDNKPESIHVNSTDLAYVIYTSGSTGKPKGVAIEHRSAVNYITWCNRFYFGGKEYGNFGLYSSLSFDLTVTSIFCTLTSGKTLTIFDQNAEVSSILEDSFSNKTAVDVIKLTPAHILLLENLNLRSNKIKKAIVGGEELTPRHVEILREISPSIEIINEYGPTEATVGCIIKDVVSPQDATTIGKPIDNTQVYILDSNYQLLPPGIPGRLFIGGAGLARYYHNRPDLTAEKFVAVDTGNGLEFLYDSGDLSRFRLNGDIDFLGRVDNQVKIRGYRIELGEIESLLIAHSGVKEQLVMAREDVPGEKKLVAYVVNKPGNLLDAVLLRDYLKQEIPDYMIPASFVFLESMPLTVNGKIDRKSLPAPDVTHVKSSVGYEEPKTSMEEVLANIWCRVLGLDKVGRNDNFFELGGHSIIGVKMFNEVEKQLGIKVQLSVIFRSPTIAELAEILNGEAGSRSWSCLVPLKDSGTKRPLFCIHMHNGNVHRWRVLVKHMDADQPVYAIQPKGLDDRQQPHTTIEEMAAHYISVIKEIQPSGPYNLIGLCFSGMVVFEMAAMLLARGEKIEFLAMVNNYAPPENATIYKVKSELNKFMKMEIGEKFNYAVEKNMNLGKKLLFKARKFIPGDSENTIKEVQIDETVESVGNDLRTIHSVALLNYHPVHVYSGDLVIFRTADPIEAFYNETLGWDRLVTGKIETTIIEGCNNDTIITDEPYNAIMALKIKEYLAGRADNESDSGNNRQNGMFSAALL
ncbi:MAG: amino acid adenylation domain-containing protein [Bacteroidetes bacterium]|nr:amino acid adenylation domain-containing protein [Bacteroidota bacterium]